MAAAPIDWLSRAHFSSIGQRAQNYQNYSIAPRRSGSGRSLNLPIPAEHQRTLSSLGRKLGEGSAIGAPTADYVPNVPRITVTVY